MFKDRLLTAALLLAWLWPAFCAHPFFSAEGDKGYIIARGAVDVVSAFSRYPGPRLLYPNETEGLGSTDLRLLVEAKAGEYIRFDINAYQNLRISSGENARLGSGVAASHRSGHLDYDWGRGDVGAPMALDQLSVTAYMGPVDLVAGRQPIGLGSNFIFSPNDLFHPFSAGAADKAFRPGVDSVRIDWAISQLSRLGAIAAMGYGEDDEPSWERSAALMKGGVNAVGFDWSVLGGKAEDRYLAGLAISGELWLLGLRSEGNVSFPLEDEDKPYVQFAAGFDHRWENTLHLMVEYYYHGNGASDKTKYLMRLAKRDMGSDPYLGEHYAGLILSGEAIPVLNLQCAVLANLTDPSAYVLPAIIYNAADEVDLIISGAIPVGESPANKMTLDPLILPFWWEFPELRSEFGSYPYSVSVMTRVYF